MGWKEIGVEILGEAIDLGVAALRSNKTPTAGEVRDSIYKALNGQLPRLADVLATEVFAALGLKAEQVMTKWEQAEAMGRKKGEQTRQELGIETEIVTSIEHTDSQTDPDPDSVTTGKIPRPKLED